MPVVRNKDGEAWDPETGHVYNDDGTVLRDGLPYTTKLSKTAAAEAIAALTEA